VNLELAERSARERRLGELADVIAENEERFGELTPQELLAQERADRRTATVVRGPRGRRPRKRAA
jgi:hypothetical protein